MLIKESFWLTSTGALFELTTYFKSHSRSGTLFWSSLTFGPYLTYSPTSSFCWWCHQASPASTKLIVWRLVSCDFLEFGRRASPVKKTTPSKKPLMPKKTLKLAGQQKNSPKDSPPKTRSLALAKEPPPPTHMKICQQAEHMWDAKEF